MNRKLLGLACSGSMLAAMLAVILWLSGVGGDTFLKVIAGAAFLYVAVLGFIGSILLMIR